MIVSSIKSLKLHALAFCLALTPLANADSEIPAVNEGLPLIFVEDFSQGADRWKPTDPDAWEVTVDEEGVPVYSLHAMSDYQPPYRSPHNISLIDNLWVSDFVLEVEMRMMNESEWHSHVDLDVFFGYQGPAQFYYVHIAPAPSSDPHANSIFLVNGEPRVSIVETRNEGNEWQRDQYHNIKVIRKVESGLIQIFFDDMENPVMETHDDTFPVGLVGIGSFDDHGYFRNVRLWGHVVEHVPEPEQ